MTFSEELLRHAIRVLGNPPGPDTVSAGNADLRRGVSAAYYALFHSLSEAAVEQIAPHVPSSTANRIHRWLDHSEMKKICRVFAAVPVQSPLKDILGQTPSPALQTVAVSFIKLQEARHSADYDLDYHLTWAQAEDLIILAVNAIAAWNRVAPSAESNIFVLSLLLWKKWDSVRI